MPALHRYIGNPFLTFVLNRMFGAGISDAHCGMRAFTKDALQKMNLKTPGMEFASEMIIEAARNKLKIAEVPIEYRPRGGGRAKLNSFHDGWRHLRFMLLYEPTAVFFIPGILIFITGLALLLLSTTERVHSMILGSFLTILGLQVITLGLYAKIYAVLYRREVPDMITGVFLRYNSLEYGMLAGFMVFLIGVGVGFNILMAWVASGYGELSQVRSAIFSVTFAILGIQMIFSAFFLSVLLLEKGE
ncbi:MAG: hypothetical protein MSIBF_07010 [Candidatus Altiarchaeales archaeon IMC4]|nr:MAG: hypothetical protein MSIBF_07010 [Candidatus Altiarchaeales archaeon IMC4]